MCGEVKMREKETNIWKWRGKLEPEDTVIGLSTLTSGNLSFSDEKLVLERDYGNSEFFEKNDHF